MITQPSILTIVDLLNTTCVVFESLDKSAELESTCLEIRALEGKQFRDGIVPKRKLGEFSGLTPPDPFPTSPTR
jgi:hypothetical protein